ncbi:MAG: WG repeat-containing protein [Microscillaceae bacterium]|jgi:serine/threonine protein kinase|nr:WG repeat-containing protein [Microscillaceae bacterium]
MFIKLQTTQYGEIEISETVLGEGGEGKVYEVINPPTLQDFVVKIYHPSERTHQKAQKLEYLIKNPPPLTDEFSVIWIEDIVYHQAQFVGHLMRKAVSGVDLTYLCSLTISDKLPPEWHEKYSRASLDGFHNRAKLCYNIASALSQIHQNQHYVLADIKPENIKIKLNGQVSLIDLDSIEVLENQQVKFSVDKLTMEYSPPERKQLQVKHDFIPETWDRFSMSVVFYKVLFGLHPFAVSGKGEYSHLVSHEEKIEAGLFPFGQMADYLEVVPKPHANFEALNFEVKNLFIQAFDKGYRLPSLRPSAAEWCEGLKDFRAIAGFYQNPQPLPRQPKPAEASTRIYARPHSHSRVKDYATSFAGLVFAISTFFFASSLFIRPELTQQEVKNKLERYRENQQTLRDADWQQTLKLLRQKYTYVIENEQHTAVVGTAEKFGIYGITGWLAPMEFDSIGIFNQGFAVFKQTQKYGLVDWQGKIVIFNIYDNMGEYGDGLIPVKSEGKYGFINLDQQLVIPYQYDDASGFDNGLAWVIFRGRERYIDQQGKFWQY